MTSSATGPMIPQPLREAVCTLAARGAALREISRSLALSRNTVRRILRGVRGERRRPRRCDAHTLVLMVPRKRG